MSASHPWSDQELGHARDLVREKWSFATIAAELSERFGTSRTASAVKLALLKTKNMTADQLNRRREYAERQRAAKLAASAARVAAKTAPRVLPPGHKLRRCLGNNVEGIACAREFVSNGPGHRMCDVCRHRSFG